MVMILWESRECTGGGFARNKPLMSHFWMLYLAVIPRSLLPGLECKEPLPFVPNRTSCFTMPPWNSEGDSEQTFPLGRLLLLDTAATVKQKELIQCCHTFLNFAHSKPILRLEKHGGHSTNEDDLHARLFLTGQTLLTFWSKPYWLQVHHAFFQTASITSFYLFAPTESLNWTPFFLNPLKNILLD